MIQKGETAKLYCAELEGVISRLIEVEVDMYQGLSCFSIVGLGDKAISEAKERVNAAIKNCGFKPPNKQNKRITVNLAPADIKKNGSQYDVSLAIGYLIASKQIANFDSRRKLFIGELALDGSIRPVPGILNACITAKSSGIVDVYIPLLNSDEVKNISEPNIIPVSNLRDLVSILENNLVFENRKIENFSPEQTNDFVDISEIRGQLSGKRALLIAAAGGHNLFMSGPPGAGKTMLAKSFVSILPDITFNEAVELTQIYSAAGLLMNKPFISYRPFRSPHHSASLVSVIGGGTNPKPGEISLAHRGVLFMDEFPEFHRDVLESLRQPLENGYVAIARSKNTISFPSKFILIGASNPCPCGYYQDAEKECICSMNEVRSYQKKLSGPLMDRIDLHLWVPRIKSCDLKKNIDFEESKKIKYSINIARDAQKERFKRFGIKCFSNSELTSKQITETVLIKNSARNILNKILDEARVSARGYFKLLKISQTIADIDCKESIDNECVHEAFSYRLRETI